jgi:hypothetical protein
LLARAWSMENGSESPQERPRLAMRHLLILPIAVVSIIYAGWNGSNLAQNIRAFKPISIAIIADLNDIMHHFPGRTIEMGVGRDASYPYTYGRPVLVFAGNPYNLDVAVAMESAEDQHGLPEATVGLCRSGLADLVLIPRGDSPFTIINWFPGARPVFSDEFRQAFQQNYERRYHSNFYDIYERKSLPDLGKVGANARVRWARKGQSDTRT